MAIATKRVDAASTSFTPAVCTHRRPRGLDPGQHQREFHSCRGSVTVLGTGLALSRPAFVAWPNLIGVLILIILFVPIRRYTLPGSLPFQLEPYRVFVALLVGGWLASLLVDRRTRFRRTGFEGPLLLIVGSAIASVVTNPDRVAQFPAEVNKSLMFLLSYVLILYVISSVIRRVENIDLLAKTLVAGGGVVAVLAIVEGRTQFNAFNHLSTVMPFLQDQGADVGGYQRLGTANLRVFGSAQHPIALSAALVMLLPIGDVPRAETWAATVDRVRARTRHCLRGNDLADGHPHVRGRGPRLPMVAPKGGAAVVAAHLSGFDRCPLRPSGHAGRNQAVVPPGRRLGRRAARKRELQRQRPSRGSRACAHALARAASVGAGIRDPGREPQRRRHRDEHLRRPMARDAARNGRDRLLRLALVLRPGSPEIRSRSETRRLRARLVAGVSGGGNRRFMRSGCSRSTHSPLSR